MNNRGNIEERMAGFISSYEAGNGDPVPFMEGLDERERRQFRLEVDRYLESNPEPVRDLPRLNDPRFAQMIGRVVARVGGESGAMPGLLVDLRDSKDLLQDDVSRALASELEASPSEAEKVDDYYHDLEFGNLPARGISEKVLSALAGILGTTSETLRKAGEALGPSGSPATGLIYTRMADDAEEVVMDQATPAMPAPAGSGRRSDPPDRIDRLFTGE